MGNPAGVRKKKREKRRKKLDDRVIAKLVAAGMLAPEVKK